MAGDYGGMPEPPTSSTYEAFWPYYVAMHSRSSTRWLHAVGTLTGAALAVDGMLRRRSWRALGWLPTVGYSFAWPSHFILERNNPASFGHPAWSLRGDLQMIRMMLAGRDGELARIAQDWLAGHPEHATAPCSRPRPGQGQVTAARSPVAEPGRAGAPSSRVGQPS